MKRVLAAAAAAILISAIGLANESDEQKIRARADEFAAAWNKHDPTTMAYIWSADGDLINPQGRSAKGLLEIQRLFQDEHSKALKQSTYTITSQKVRFITPTLALVDQDAEVSGIANPDGTTATFKPHVVALWRKSGGEWWIAAARAYSYTPPPAPPAPK